MLICNIIIFVCLSVHINNLKIIYQMWVIHIFTQGGLVLLEDGLDLHLDCKSRIAFVNFWQYLIDIIYR